MSSISVQVKEMNDIEECPICMATLVDPRVLPCLRTFCLQCIEKYGEKRNASMPCPLCRQEFNVPSGGMRKLPVNFFILKLLEIKKVSSNVSGNICCDLCENEADETSPRNATAYCFDCQKSLCDKCCKHHKKLRHISLHKVMEFGKQQTDEMLKCITTYCEIHTEESVKYYCSDCKKAICSTCYVEDHNGHIYLNFGESC